MNNISLILLQSNENEVIGKGSLLRGLLESWASWMDGDTPGALSEKSHKVAGERDIDHIFLMKLFCCPRTSTCVCIVGLCMYNPLGASNNKGVSLQVKLWERSKKIAWKGGGYG